MSRTSKIVSRPAVNYLEWSSEDGCFKYYDKDLEQKVLVNLPFKFAVLDGDWVTVKGYNSKKEKGFYSNEIKDLKKEELVVKCGKEEFARGLWADIKEKLGDAGAKFTKSVYIAVKNQESGEYEVWNLQLKGGSLTGGNKPGVKPSKEDAFDGWINFTKALKQSLYSKFIVVNNVKPKKNGATKFVIPVYSTEDMTAEESATFDKMDIALKLHMKEYHEYLKTRRDDDKTSEVDDSTYVPDVEEAPVEPDFSPDDLPF
jgi:hypothetical protein